jgi:hypothetical protein
MRATVAQTQGEAPVGFAERSGRQIRDHRYTNRQRGRMRAASVLANAKPKTHQDASSRAGWRAEKVEVLTRGELPAERLGEVSRGHSSKEVPRKRETAKGQSTSRWLNWKVIEYRPENSGMTRSCNCGNFLRQHEAEEPVQPGVTATGELKSNSMSTNKRQP